MQYHLLSQEGRQSITVFHAGEVYIADDQHPNFETIKMALVGNELPDRVVDLFDIEATVNRHFERLSERVLVRDGKVLVDGDELNSDLTRQILAFLQEGLDFDPLVNFLEKILTNPNPHSREHLYRWLKDRRFTITDDGDFIAYKSVQLDKETGQFLSWSSGDNVVIADGEEVTGRVPNNLGTVVEMPRSEVTFDPAIGCSVGLHAGTMSYARNFNRQHGQAVVSVKINPRDVISVPTDSSEQKLRVCRYRVLEVVEDEYATPLTTTPWEGWDDWDLDEDSEDFEAFACPECGNDVANEGDVCDDCLEEEEDEEDEEEPASRLPWWKNL